METANSIHTSGQIRDLPVIKLPVVNAKVKDRSLNYLIFAVYCQSMFLQFYMFTFKKKCHRLTAISTFTFIVLFKFCFSRFNHFIACVLYEVERYIDSILTVN